MERGRARTQLRRPARLVQRADEAAVGWIARRRRSPVREAATAVAHLGRGGLVWIALPTAVRLAETRRPRAAARAALAVVIAFGGSVGLARVLRRTRPCQSGTEALVPCPQGPGLPSDQVAAAFAGASSIARTHPAMALPLHAGALAVGAARVYVGVHYPSDVAAGALLGMLVGRLVAPARR